MTTLELIPIMEQLERIEKKLNGSFSNKYLNICQVSKITSLSSSTIRRAIMKGELSCAKRTGKLLVSEINVHKWLGGR
ncbi:MAG: helix-turn-helix domain-containing protein [Candidatus Marinimicrobia bacterium]|jgi:hypothetical protein|nr:helix-turn-helix domain-containing protein [Candidatus Neomarinimicrobiota bacterium]